MPPNIEPLFRKFRDDGTPAALAEVFDRTAAELLRVACHVASDLAAAEDLVQATFLTAIESARSWDEKRPLLPWLLGILANHARAARRAGARASGHAETRVPELRVLPRPEPSPLAVSQSRELDQLVQRELDLLAEPYREVAILSLRHGLKPNEIARALGRSPGAVRVQLHRALEQVRRKVPRSAAALASLIGGELGRGLASIKVVVVKSAAAKVVVAAAAAAAAGSVAVISIGSLVVTKKVALVAAVVLLAAATTTFVVWKQPKSDASWNTKSDPASAAAASAAASVREPADDSGAKPNGVAEPAAKRVEERESPPVAAMNAVRFDGEVHDGETLAPIAGATIEYFEPMRMRLSEVKRKFASYADVAQWNGVPRFHGAWPKLVEPLPDGAWRDAADVELLAPDPAARASTEARTGADGRFDLSASRRVGLLVVAHADYERQLIPLTDGGGTLSIALFAALPIRGVVVDEKQAPVGGIELLFQAWDQRTQRKGERKPRLLGPWLVVVAADGTFQFAAGAPEVGPDSATIGFEVTGSESGATRDAPMRVHVRRLPVLTVLDAATKQPLEDFSLLVISQNHGSPVHAGRFHARGGRIQFEAPRPRSPNVAFPAQEAAAIDVWNDDHAPARVALPPAEERRDLTVELAAGRPFELAGRLLRAGKPIADTTIELNAFYPLGWNENSLHKIDETSTRDHGAFALHGPAGRFVVRVQVDGKPLMRVVELPASGPFVLDVAAGGRIDVVVRDPGGTPRADAKVAIHGPNEKQEMTHTDANGRAGFEWLVAGEYYVGLHGTREVHVAIPQDSKKVQVADGTATAVELTAPPAGPIHLRIHAEGTTDYTGWSGRDATYVATEWTDLAVDGTLGEDAVNFAMVGVEAPDGATWRIDVTPQLLAAGVVELPVSDVGYRGQAVDRVTGAPLVHATVRADDATVRADEEGRFVLKNLEAKNYTLSVQRAPSGSRDRRDRRRAADAEPTAWFRPAQPAAPGGREVTLRVPEVDRATMSGEPRRVFTGRVVRKSGGAAVGNAALFLHSTYRDDDGEWSVGVEGSWARSATDGAFRLVVPRAPTYALDLYEETGDQQRRATHVTWSDDGGDRETIERDVVLD